MEADEAGNLSLEFCYMLGGLRLDLTAGPAARAVWKDGMLSELTIHPRSYRLGEEVSGLLPEKQAAAAAGSLRRGAAPELALPDGGEEKLEPKWIVTVDGRDLWKQED